MNNNALPQMILCVSLTAGFVGCSRAPNPDQELQKAANAFEKPQPAQPSPQRPTQPQQAQQPAPPAAPAPPPQAQQFNEALAAYKSGQMEDAVTRFQRLRASPTLTPEQRMALNDAMAAVMTEIYSLAAKGDARAQQAAKQYEQMQTSRQAR